MLATQTVEKISTPSIPLLPDEANQKKQNWLLKKRNVQLEKVIDEYGYTDTGIFAVSLARAYGLRIAVILYQGFPLHIFCEARSGFVDAFGVRNPVDLIDSLKREYGLGSSVITDANSLRLVRVTEQEMHARYSKHSENDIQVADEYRLIFESAVGKHLLVPA